LASLAAILMESYLTSLKFSLKAYMYFYTRDATGKRGLCCRKMAWWLDVCLSHAGIVSERRNPS